MSHTPTTRAIDQFVADATKQKDPMVFLREFGPLHNRWHSTSRSTRNLGFLLFHWQVVGAFKKSRADKIWPGNIKPFSLAEWKKFKWPYDVSMKVKAGDFNSLAAFSLAIESWHNEAHMAVMNATGEDLMNPATNVFLRNFWRLHYFIDARFLAALAAFEKPGSVAQKIEGVEKKYHARLREV
jgi:hypothetical protein